MNKKILIISIVTLVLDQISKIVITSLINLEDTIVIIKNFFSLTNVTNTGAAFSILENKTWFLVILGFICLLLLIKMMRETKSSKLSNFAFGLVTGGIFGNLSDRLFLGSVRDFLKFKIFGYNFPVFNIADSAIVVGVIILIVICFIDGGSNENNSRKSRKSLKN